METLFIGSLVSVTHTQVFPLNDTVEVTGIPKLKLSNGSEATYSNGSGTSTLFFSYTPQAGDLNQEKNLFL